MTICLQKAFRGRRVLVTGHTGFKGAWLCMWLDRLGARVTGYALPPPTDPSLFKICSLNKLVDHHTGDVRDGNAIRNLIKKTKPDFIFHLAAQSLVRTSYRLPVETFETNVLGTVNLLNAVREIDRPCSVVVVSSDKCYENREISTGYRETDPMGGSDPYSASKGCTELAAACWRKSFFSGNDRIRLATARAGNVIGGGDWAADRIVPDCINAICAGKPIVVRSPSSIRPWQHVLEPLCGYLTLAAHLDGRDGERFCSGWNFGPGACNSKTVRQLVEKIITYWGKGRWKEAPNANRDKPETNILTLNCDKARRHLGWHATWGFDRTIRETIDWYKAWHEGDRKLRGLCLRQIEDFRPVSGDQ